ncbi:MAG: DNA repair protein RecN [Verrucomicrobiia bacterium Tous-C3TDCM]|nr:MAG: DNA repair protein RecN [Verrucomicrobiae bacterium Tous-C3TDCM]PAZ05311.1 MAG: DNA repair protein RecN [Verrucomicrobiae bacterium AMD-G2]
MLTLLKIRNLALVDEVTWELDRGLISVTGETGAGKSVIVGALKLVLGERADKSLIRTGEESCTVEAVFSLSTAEEIQAILAENALDFSPGDDLIIRRVIGQSNTRQFINDSPVTLGLLKKLGEHLVDLHGPHDHQSLLSTDRQMAMLDAYANADLLVSQYRGQWQQWKQKVAEWEDLRNADAVSTRELDLLRHQVDEINAANFQPDEETELMNRYRRANSAARLLENTTAAMALLAGEEDGILTRLGEMQRHIRDLEKLDPSIGERCTGLETAVVELQELESTLADYLDELEINPEEAAALEDRVNQLESLKRKYGGSIGNILLARDEASNRLDNIENRGEKLDLLQAQITELRSQLDAAANKLSSTRRKAAPKLAKEIAAQLKDLGFKQSAFEISLTALKDPSSHGMESTDFLFGPNPGEPLHPLRHVASSGEISRVMLAVKSALADQDATPLMVFDEIDANVGGEVAKAVGRKMAVLGARHQVIAITHFPQVAATAARHFVVEKEISHGRTRSRLYPVTGEARIHELVRMLGGGGESARAMAKSLLES